MTRTQNQLPQKGGSQKELVNLSKQTFSSLAVIERVCKKVFITIIMAIGIPLLLTIFSLPAEGDGSVYQRIFTSTDFTALMMSINISLVVELLGIRGSSRMAKIRGTFFWITLFFMGLGLFLVAAASRGNIYYYLDLHIKEISGRYDVIVFLLMLMDYTVISYDEDLMKR